MKDGADKESIPHKGNSSCEGPVVKTEELKGGPCVWNSELKGAGFGMRWER